MSNLVGAMVKAGSNTCGTISSADVNAGQMVSFTCNQYAGVIKVELPSSTTANLNICEVEAFTGQCSGRK